MAIIGNINKRTLNLAIFFSDDGHVGLLKYKESELVYKTVIKFPIEEY